MNDAQTVRLGRLTFVSWSSHRRPLLAERDAHLIHIVTTQCPKLRCEAGSFDGAPGVMIVLPAGSGLTVRTDRAHGLLSVSVPARDLRLDERASIPVFQHDGLLRVLLHRCHDVARLGSGFVEERVVISLVGTILCGTLAEGQRRDRSAVPPVEIDACLHRIEETLAEPIRVDDLVALSGLPRSQFYARFRTAVGKNPYAYVLSRRLDRARELIEGSDAPLAQVALACGFASQSHLTDAFRDRLGVTPGRYRADTRAPAAALG